jgi:Ornithine decarboxylase antizyme
LALLQQQQQLPTIPELACSPSESGSDDGVYDVATGSTPAVDAFLEIWDYSGGSRFRGFVAERPGSKGLFIFFDQGAFGHDLKAG